MSSTAYSTHFSTRQTPQTEPIPGEAQVPNNAGGYVYSVDAWTAFERFLILGSEGGTYYSSEAKLTKGCAANALACIAGDGRRAVDLIVAVSDAGRAPKNDPAIFALALASADPNPDTRAQALAALPKVCRIPTHLFHFLTFVRQHRGMGRGLRRAIAAWYQSFTPEKLAFEIVKYQARAGWSHGDALRVSHPALGNLASARFALGLADGPRDVVGTKKDPRSRAYASAGERPAILAAFEEAKVASPARLVELIHAHRLTREMVPTEALAKPEVWEALLTAGHGMPLTALLRNLGNLSKVGLLAPMSEASKIVCARVRDGEAIRKARVHPVAVLIALKTYASGHGMRGSGQWATVPAVIDALDDALYLAFDAVEPTGKRLLFGVDISGSMSVKIAGLPITSAEAAAVMALVCAKTESDYYIMGFANTFRDLKITPRMRLDDVLKVTEGQTFGGTDCALPMTWAAQHGVAVDAFIVITDSETWAGFVHPKQALKAYRERFVADAKQAVLATTPSPFTIADPADPRALDLVGFDTTTPQALSAFLRL